MIFESEHSEEPVKKKKKKKRKTSPTFQGLEPEKIQPQQQNNSSLAQNNDSPKKQRQKNQKKRAEAVTEPSSNPHSNSTNHEDDDKYWDTMNEENLKKLEVAQKQSSDQKVDKWLTKAKATFKTMRQNNEDFYLD